MLETSLSGADLVRQRHFRVLKFTGDSRDRGATLKVGKGGGGGVLTSDPLRALGRHGYNLGW